MPSHPDRVRQHYICHLCGCSLLDGQHGIYEFEPESMNIIVCRPMMFVRYPKYRGVITNITEP